MIKTNNLNIKYKNNEIINNINLEIEEGKITYIIGKNGSGKSTLINAIAGLKKYKGEIFIDDKNLNKMDNVELRKKIGVVFQNPTNQIVFNRVYDDIKFTLENMNMDKEKIDATIKEALSKVGMVEYIDADPFTLSLGQRQKIAIAGILALDSKYIILDEATSFLDINSKKDIYKLIRELVKDKNIIFVTNIMDELIYADDIIIVDKKKIYKYTKEQIINDNDILRKHDLDIPFVFKAINKFGIEEIRELF